MVSSAEVLVDEQVVIWFFRDTFMTKLWHLWQGASVEDRRVSLGASAKLDAISKRALQQDSAAGKAPAPSPSPPIGSQVPHDIPATALWHHESWSGL
jgi:hypothetical protein